MKRLIALALMISLLVLQGCSSQSAWEGKLEEKRLELIGAQSVTFTADVVAHIGSQEFSCKMNCLADDSGVTVEVLEPEIIAGVKAHISSDCEISYEGVQLYVGDLTCSGVTPVTAVATVVRAMLSGFTQEIWQEQYGEMQLVVMQFYEDENTNVKIWFQTDSLVPVHAEIVCDGAVVFSCDVSEYSIA